jgi:hypothetical protein
MNASNACTAMAAAALLAACASEMPTNVGVAEGITTMAVVTLLGGDFALLDGVRMPFDAVVLRLRLRTRAMSKDELATFGVHVVVGKDVPESAEPRVVADRGQLIDELGVMRVGYVKT